MIRFLVRTFTVFLIFVVLLAGALYFVDKEYLLKRILVALPTDTPISLGQVSLSIDEASDNTLYGFEMVDKRDSPIQRTINAEYAQVNYDSNEKVINIILHKGTIKEKNLKSTAEATSQSFDQLVITLDPGEIKSKLKQFHKQKDSLNPSS